MRWVGHVAQMGEKMNANRLLWKICVVHQTLLTGTRVKLSWY
jgi:hypothetical protein